MVRMSLQSRTQSGGTRDSRTGQSGRRLAAGVVVTIGTGGHTGQLLDSTVGHSLDILNLTYGADGGGGTRVAIVGDQQLTPFFH